MTPLRYAAAACQTDLPNPLDRRQMAANTDRMLAMIDAAFLHLRELGSPPPDPSNDPSNRTPT